MTERPETETVARLLARGYNRHIKDHGPDGDYAGEVTETSDGHGLIVSRDGAEFAVRVERVQAMTEPDAVTPSADADFEHRGMGICNKGRRHTGACDHGHGV